MNRGTVLVPPIHLTTFPQCWVVVLIAAVPVPSRQVKRIKVWVRRRRYPEPSHHAGPFGPYRHPLRVVRGLVGPDLVRVVHIPVRVDVRQVPRRHVGTVRVVVMVVRRCRVSGVAHSLMVVLLLVEMGLVEVGVAQPVAVTDDLVWGRMGVRRLCWVKWRGPQLRGVRVGGHEGCGQIGRPGRLHEPVRGLLVVVVGRDRVRRAAVVLLRHGLGGRVPPVAGTVAAHRGVHDVRIHARVTRSCLGRR